MRKVLFVLLTACLLFVSSALFASVSEIKLRLAHVVNEKDIFHVAAVKFKELVEERTNGRVQIDIYPNAVLGDERTLLEGMQLGTIDMGVITNGPVANFLPEIAVFELPFLFANAQEAYAVLDGPVGKDLLKSLEKVNLKGLAYAERGFRNITNSKRPVRTPADLKGLKIRVMENPVYIDTFKALGANVIPMAWTEALTALQQGTIDGQENPIVVIHSFKLYETQKYLSLTRHTYAPALIIMSLKVFKSLPSDIQKIFEECAQQAAEYARKVNGENEERLLKELIDFGMQVTQPDLNAFREAVKSVYDKYSARFGKYLKEIQKQLEELRSNK
ncbi:TRAP transporter substrate-binding protein [Pseudothermotoga thermarum]|uniref:TRAP dicarboxylate transporter, DctP subunit n=1 Tax=Pseudothermotoga thermarum DSM 5069 TaxID=688269 RepID=F7YV14_9THEM|nr:TRAP transporter substrate-binding protein [Pseudothermotoga thermarum]AEH50298.1 TRAP dicarboxylate transporter, DctP subunit [Pseudothermotoga thermarum DSM 5069]